MAFRSDVTVDWNVSPRIVTVLDPSTEITLQDLHDTLTSHEDEPAAMSYAQIVKSEGKSPLGGGLFVGITTTLLNAVLAFQARKSWTDTGSVTTGDATGRVLVDSLAAFITAGVSPGSFLVNLTDGSVASVLRVTSQTQLVTDVLGGGTDNRFDVADAYKTINPVQCTVSQGNLLAVDSNGAAMLPLLATAGTLVSRASSTSAALLSGSAPADVAEAVWQKTVPGAYPVGSAGAKLGDLPSLAAITAAVAGTGLTPTQAAMLVDLYRLGGLDPTRPLVVTPTSRRVPAVGTDINQTISDAAGTVTVTRVP